MKVTQIKPMRSSFTFTCGGMVSRSKMGHFVLSMIPQTNHSSKVLRKGTFESMYIPESTAILWNVLYLKYRCYKRRSRKKTLCCRIFLMGSRSNAALECRWAIKFCHMYGIYRRCFRYVQIRIEKVRFLLVRLASAVTVQSVTLSTIFINFAGEIAFNAIRLNGS
ncbi:hypothetical protein OESDEN_24134 [Oesophagostomum dentatum]|uniref:Uncharacterized protein n=1 Tax=Oesophagostomum dentatum TaxID=61180 RepID=A0A0B1RX84_OESDE|nr:hypothetical protein OESDEN_24134 [Oesophagostomum dentatum]